MNDRACEVPIHDQCQRVSSESRCQLSRYDSCFFAQFFFHHEGYGAHFKSDQRLVLVDRDLRGRSIGSCNYSWARFGAESSCLERFSDILRRFIEAESLEVVPTKIAVS